MSKPNVTLLTNFVPPYRLALYRVLSERFGGFRVLVSTPMDANRHWRVDHGGINVEIQRTLTLARPSRHPHGFRDQIYVHIPYDTLGRLSRLKPDVVLSFELGARTIQALIYRRLRPRSRLIVWAPLSEYTELGRDWLRQFLRRGILPNADAIIVNGASGARYMKAFGVPQEKIFVVPQTTDVHPFSSLPFEKGSAERRRLLYVGRLVELKGLSPFLSVLSRWCRAHPRESVEFWLVGDGPERVKLEGMAHPPNLVLRFWGNVGYGELPSFYAQAGILVFPTLADTWGLIVNESMAAGLPVLGSLYSQAVEDVVEDGLTGWKFRPDCPEDMYRALDRTLTTPSDQIRQMGAAARRRAEQLTPELAADRIMDAVRFSLDREHHEPEVSDNRSGRVLG